MHSKPASPTKSSCLALETSLSGNRNAVSVSASGNDVLPTAALAIVALAIAESSMAAALVALLLADLPVADLPIADS